MAADFRAAVLVRQDYFMTRDRLMLADVPIHGTTTVYGLLGDWFAWTAIALFVLLIGLAIKARRTR
jgi:apolipoprotein N-acyltransferase